MGSAMRELFRHHVLSAPVVVQANLEDLEARERDALFSFYIFSFFCCSGTMCCLRAWWPSTFGGPRGAIEREMLFSTIFFRSRDLGQFKRAYRSIERLTRAIDRSIPQEAAAGGGAYAEFLERSPMDSPPRFLGFVDVSCIVAAFLRFAEARPSRSIIVLDCSRAKMASLFARLFSSLDSSTSPASWRPSCDSRRRVCLDLTLDCSIARIKRHSLCASVSWGEENIGETAPVS